MKRKTSSKISEHDLDKAFSKYIRQRGYCEYCGRRPPAVILQASHFFSRSARSVRYDEKNVDCFCAGCHFKLETRKNGEYLDWKKKQLGLKAFNALRRRYYTMRKRPPTEAEKKEMLEKFSTCINPSRMIE